MKSDPCSGHCATLCIECVNARIRQMIEWSAAAIKADARRCEATESLAITRDSELRRDIAIVLNRHSRENGSDTPDFVLAEYLTGCLEAFDRAVTRREDWYGRAKGEPNRVLTRETT